MLSSPAVEIPTAAAARAAAAVKAAWRAGAAPDARAALAEHPFLLQFKSVVVDLAYEEFCLREDAGAAPDPVSFAGRMPAYRSSVLHVVQAHRLVADHPDLVPAPPADWPAPGEVVEGLTVRAELGRGAFARAYLAYDPGTDRDCVLKLCSSRGGEGRALGPLSHPHITPVYWARPAGGFSAVCMPLLGAVTLEDVREDAFWGNAVRRSADLILDRAATAAYAPAAAGRGRSAVVRRGDSYPVAVAAVAARVADALAYLHARGREHGDLKPSNVVVAPGGRPYLIDFNLAAPADPEAPPAGIGGTVPFLAPERLRALAGGEPAPADRGEADVFALGATAFALLAGDVPWSPTPDPDPRAAAAAQLAGRADAPRPRWPARVPAPVARVVEGCLAAEPAARPAAAEVAAVLDRWVAGRRRVRKTRWAGVAAAGLLAAGILVVFGWPTPGPVRTAAGAGVAAAPDPVTAEDYIQRGRERFQQNQYEAARADFDAALVLEPGPRTLAYAAFGRTMRANESAVQLGIDAITEAGDRASAGVYTNLGSAYLQRGRPAAALPHLDKAVELDPDSVVARFNRALARFRTGLDPDTGRLPDRGCVEDMQVVLRTDPASAEVFFQAARMWAASAHLDPALRDRAVEYLEAAVRLGDDPSKYPTEPALAANLGGHPGFARVVGLPTPPGPAKRVNLKVADPDGQ